MPRPKKVDANSNAPAKVNNSQKKTTSSTPKQPTATENLVSLPMMEKVMMKELLIQMVMKEEVRLLKRLFVHMKSVMKIQDMHFTSFYLNMKMLIMSGTLSTLFMMIILHMRTGMVIKSSVRTIQKMVIM